jgi:hypothetical protein
MTRGKKYEPPLFLDMDFEEALERFGTTDPKEVKELMDRAKERKPPGPKVPTTSRVRDRGKKKRDGN